MHDELTQVDIDKMKEEIRYRKSELRPKLIQIVQEARALGDLSENFEYSSAKREMNRNNSRIRYLERMIDTAIVISDHSSEDTVGLFDRIELYYPEDNETRTVVLVTTLRQDALHGYVSKESPLGQSLLGHRAGDTVTVVVNERCSYPVEIRAITKGEDDTSLEISPF